MCSYIRITFKQKFRGEKGPFGLKKCKKKNKRKTEEIQKEYKDDIIRLET